MDFKDLIRILPPHYVHKMKHSPQDPIHHPEGSVYTHTFLVFMEVKKAFPDDIDMQIAAIFHDIGKLKATQICKKDDETEKISHHGHEDESLKFFIRYANLFEDKISDREKVKTIIKYHMRIKLYISGAMTKERKRLKMESNPYFEDLLKFAECDRLGSVAQ